MNRWYLQRVKSPQILTDNIRGQTCRKIIISREMPKLTNQNWKSPEMENIFNFWVQRNAHLWWMPQKLYFDILVRNVQKWLKCSKNVRSTESIQNERTFYRCTIFIHSGFSFDIKCNFRLSKRNKLILSPLLTFSNWSINAVLWNGRFFYFPFVITV